MKATRVYLIKRIATQNSVPTKPIHIAPRTGLDTYPAPYHVAHTKASHKLDNI